MCTTTNEGIEVVEPRDINVLLALDTYQGMTDEEIDLVLDYKIAQATSSAEITVKAAAEIERMEQCIADNRASAQAAYDMLYYICLEDFPSISNLQPLTFTPRSIGE